MLWLGLYFSNNVDFEIQNKWRSIVWEILLFFTSSVYVLSLSVKGFEVMVYTKLVSLLDIRSRSTSIAGVSYVLYHQSMVYSIWHRGFADTNNSIKFSKIYNSGSC